MLEVVDSVVATVVATEKDSSWIRSHSSLVILPIVDTSIGFEPKCFICINAGTDVVGLNSNFLIC